MIALDVGGTRLKGAVIQDGTQELWTLQRATGAGDGPQAVVRTVLETLEQLRANPTARDAGACGLVLPGIVDSSTGRAVWSENLGWREIPLGALAGERTGLPVAVGHDVRAGGLAEAQLGAARHADNVLFVPIGTGIGAAIIADGRVVDGNGMAGELGHIDVGHDEPCACGATGCLEAIASAAALARRYRRRTRNDVDGAEDVLGRVRNGDRVAEEVWDQAVDALASGLATACALLAPEIIVIGGGLAGAGSELITPVSTRLAARLTFHRRPRVVATELGDRAGCLGAGLLARALLQAGTGRAS